MTGEEERMSEFPKRFYPSNDPPLLLYRLAGAARYILGTLDGEETGEEDAAERHEKGEEEWRNK